MSRGGGGLDRWTDERQPNAGRLQLTKWRSEVEKVVLTCTSSYFYLFGSGTQANVKRRMYMASWSGLGSCMEDQVHCPG